MSPRRTWTSTRLALIATLTTLAVACRSTAPPTKPVTAPLPAGVVDAATLDAALTPYLESFGKVRGEAAALSGYVLVQQGEHTLFGRGFGWADQASGVERSTDRRH